MTGAGDGAGRWRHRRRAVLATVAGLAGCLSLGGGESTDRPTTTNGSPSGERTATGTPTRTRARTPTATDSVADTDAPTATPTTAVLAAVSGDYPAYRHDAGRRAYTPATAGPVEVPEVAYTLELPAGVAQPVVDGHRLSLAWPGDDADAPTVATYDLRRGTLLWEADVEAPATSPPVVVGDRLLVQTPRGIYAFDDEGEIAWRSRAVTEGGVAPAAVGERVYAVGRRGMAALGFDGTEAWSIPLGAQPLAPAAADESAVYLLVPRDTTTMGLVAFDAANGRAVWRRAVEAQSGFPPARAGDAVYVTSDRRQGGVTALAADSGDRLWRTDVRLDRGAAVAESVITIARGSEVIGLSRADGAVEWSTDLASEVITHPVADNATAYVGLEAGDGGRLAAVATASGTIRYTVAFDRPVSRVVILQDGLAVTTGDGGSGPERLHVLVGA